MGLLMDELERADNLMQGHYRQMLRRFGAGEVAPDPDALSDVELMETGWEPDQECL